jgi:RND family efflux transporter MFP subunit
MKARSVCLAAALSLCGVSCHQKQAPPPPPPKVQVLTVSPRDLPIFHQWIGTIDGYPNAQIRAQVAGYLLKQDYVEGGNVKKGDLLFEIDPRPFQALLNQATAKLAQDQASFGKTELDVKRYTPLAKEQAISQQELDNAVQANLMAQASLAADRAAIESAQMNLGFTKITSPVDGIAGTALAQIGDLAGPNGSVLTTVSTIDPVRVYFNIDEQFYLTNFRQFTNNQARAAHDQEMELQLILSDGSVYPRRGKWVFLGRQIDLETGTLQVAASFDNPDFELRPGQYALVRAKTGERPNVLLVPQRAVTELQGAFQVATVDGQNTAHLKTVRVGEQVGAEWLIETGLETSDRIIVEGLQKVKEGTVVEPEPFVVSPAKPAEHGVKQG